MLSILAIQTQSSFVVKHKMATMTTIAYSRVETLDIQLDLYLPPDLKEGPVPAIVHFHGGGMIAGCRKTLFYQQWLKRTCSVSKPPHSLIFRGKMSE